MDQPSRSKQESRCDRHKGKSKKKRDGRPKPRKSSPVEAEEVPSDTFYKIKGILQQKSTGSGSQYLIDWEDNLETGESFDPTWEPKENVTAAAIEEWENDNPGKALKARSSTAINSQDSEPVRGPKRRRAPATPPAQPALKRPRTAGTSSTARYSVVKDVREIKDSYEEEQALSSVPEQGLAVVMADKNIVPAEYVRFNSSQISSLQSQPLEASRVLDVADSQHSGLSQKASTISQPPELSQMSAPLSRSQPVQLSPLNKVVRRRPFIWDEEIPDSCESSGGASIRASYPPVRSEPESDSTGPGNTQAAEPKGSSGFPWQHAQRAENLASAISGEVSNNSHSNPHDVAMSSALASSSLDISSRSQASEVPLSFPKEPLSAEVDKSDQFLTQESYHPHEEGGDEKTQTQTQPQAQTQEGVSSPSQETRSTQLQNAQVVDYAVQSDEPEPEAFLSRRDNSTHLQTVEDIGQGFVSSREPEHNNLPHLVHVPLAEQENRTQERVDVDENDISTQDVTEISLDAQINGDASLEHNSLPNGPSATSGSDTHNEPHHVDCSTSESIWQAAQSRSLSLEPSVNTESLGHRDTPIAGYTNLSSRLVERSSLEVVSSIEFDEQVLLPRPSPPSGLMDSSGPSMSAGQLPPRPSLPSDTDMNEPFQEEHVLGVPAVDANGLLGAAFGAQDNFDLLSSQSLLGPREIMPDLPSTEIQPALSPMPSAETDSPLSLRQLQDDEYIVPVPMVNWVRDIYDSIVQKRREELKEYTQNPDSDLDFYQIDLMLEELKLVCDHPDLLTTSRDSSSSQILSEQARYAIAASTKLLFVDNLLESLRHTDSHVVIFARQGSAIHDIIESLFRYRKIQYSRPDQPTPSSDAGESTVKVTLLQTWDRPQNYVMTPPASIVIGFDTTASREEHLSTVVPPGHRVPWISVLVGGSVEHIEACISEEMDSSERKQCLVYYTAKLRKKVGRIDYDFSKPEATAAMVAEFVTARGEKSWPLPPLPDILGVHLSVKGTPTQSILQDSISASQVTHKRAASPNGILTPKRQKLSPAINEDIEQMQNQDVSAQSESGTQEYIKVLEARVKELEYLETRVKDLEHSHKKIAPRYKEALNDRARFERQHAESFAKEQKMKLRFDRQAEEMKKLQEEKVAIQTDLEGARVSLSSSTIPEKAEMHKLKDEKRALQAEVESLRKSVKGSEANLDYTRASYRTASEQALKFKRELEDLETRTADLRARDVGERLEIAKLNKADQNKADADLIETLQADLAAKDRLLDKANDDLSALMQNRRNTRTSSAAPRSPRVLGAQRGFGTKGSRASSPGSDFTPSWRPSDVQPPPNRRL